MGRSGAVDETRSLTPGICSQKSPPSLDTDACGGESPFSRIYIILKNIYFYLASLDLH